MENELFTLFIPKNSLIKEYGYFEWNEILDLISKYRYNPKIIEFISKESNI